VGSYWLDAQRPDLPDVRLSGPADVAVVGGGITGCACALALAEGGLRVVLHEARELAGGASGRNGGFALRGGAMPYDSAREWLGPRPARTFWQWTERHLDRLADLSGEALRRTGSLRLAADDEERAELRGEFDALRVDGFAAEWLEHDELDWPVHGRFAAAILHPDDGTLHPARATWQLALRAAEAGVEIREHSRVDDPSALEAERVVVATDGYPSGLLGRLEGSIIPTRGQMLATEPIPERLFERPHYGRHGYDYWHQAPDGSILAGGFRDADLASEFTDEEATTPTIQTALETFLTELLGRAPRITHRWAGIFGLVPDLMPVVGRAPGSDRLWVAGGYSGHGNVLGLACGELVAAAILGREAPLLELFDPLRLDLDDAV
jgi:glycine/D-amino acid oxidase-like deaminating enzyme